MRGTKCWHTWLAGYLSFPSLLLLQVPGIHGFSGRGESRWNSLVGWLKRSPNCSCKKGYFFHGFNLSFRSWISINGYDWLRWPALCGNSKCWYSGFVIAPPFHNIHCPGKLVLGLLFYPTEALLWKWRLYSNWSVKVSLLRPLLNIPSSGLTRIFRFCTLLVRSLKVKLINSNWRTVSVFSAWFRNVIALERISRVPWLAKRFPVYLYSQSLHTW